MLKKDFRLTILDFGTPIREMQEIKKTYCSLIPQWFKKR